MRVWSSALLLGSSALLLAGCPTKADPLACMGGCDHQEEKTFCDVDGVYPGSELANECIEPPSPDACNSAEPCGFEDRPHCTDLSMGVCVQCLEDDHCERGESCNTADNTCVPFACTPGEGGDAECVAFDEGLPFCSDSETCVECLISDDCTGAAASVCDDEAFACRGCEANAECGTLVCDEDAGTCAEEAEVVYVAAMNGSGGGSCGTLSDPCDSINTALGRLEAGRRTIVLLAGDHTERAQIDNAGEVIVIGAEGARIRPALGEDQFAVRVSGNSDVRFEDVAIALSGGQNGSGGLECDCSGPGTPSFAMIGGEVSGAQGIGLQAEDCSLEIRGSSIAQNGGGGIAITNSDYSIVNNFIFLNGSATSGIGGARISTTSTRSEALEFNTFARNQRGSTERFGLNCDVTNLEASNNIFMLAEASSAGLVGGDCSHSFSLFDADDSTAPTGNDNISANADFVDPDNGDFHLNAGSAGIDDADPASTIDVDFDGDPRPQGEAPDIGADEAG